MSFGVFQGWGLGVEHRPPHGSCFLLAEANRPLPPTAYWLRATGYRLPSTISASGPVMAARGTFGRPRDTPGLAVP